MGIIAHDIHVKHDYSEFYRLTPHEARMQCYIVDIKVDGRL